MKIVLLIGKKHGLGSLKIFSDNFDISKVYIFKEELGWRQISLPFYPGLRIREIEYVTANLKRIVKSA